MQTPHRRKCEILRHASTSRILLLSDYWRHSFLSMFVMHRINVNKRSQFNFLLDISYLSWFATIWAKNRLLSAQFHVFFYYYYSVQFCQLNLCWYFRWFSVLNLSSVELFFRNKKTLAIVIFYFHTQTLYCLQGDRETLLPE